MSAANSRSSRRRMWRPIDARLVVPEHPVVHEQQLRALDRGAIEHLERRGDGAGDALDALGADHLHADRGVVAVAVRLELGVEEGQDLVACCAHRGKSRSRQTLPGPRCGPGSASGCPDSNWGPLRPERSALPGCATPRKRRLSHNRAQLPARRQKRTSCTCSPPGPGEREAEHAERADRERRADDADDDGEARRRAEREGAAQAREREDRRGRPRRAGPRAAGRARRARASGACDPDSSTSTR